MCSSHGLAAKLCVLLFLFLQVIAAIPALITFYNSPNGLGFFIFVGMVSLSGMLFAFLRLIFRSVKSMNSARILSIVMLSIFFAAELCIVGWSIALTVAFALPFAGQGFIYNCENQLDGYWNYNGIWTGSSASCYDLQVLYIVGVGCSAFLVLLVFITSFIIAAIVSYNMAQEKEVRLAKKTDGEDDANEPLLKEQEEEQEEEQDVEAVEDKVESVSAIPDEGEINIVVEEENNNDKKDM